MGRLTLGRSGMLGPEILKVLLVGVVLGCFFVISQFRIVLLLRTIGLPFAGFTLFGREHLPSLSNYLGDLSERKLLTLQNLSNLCDAISLAQNMGE